MNISKNQVKTILLAIQGAIGWEESLADAWGGSKTPEGRASMRMAKRYKALRLVLNPGYQDPLARFARVTLQEISRRAKLPC